MCTFMVNLSIIICRVDVWNIDIYVLYNHNYIIYTHTHSLDEVDWITEYSRDQTFIISGVNM